LVLKDLELTYVMRDEALVITTPEDAESQLFDIVYPVRDLAQGKGDIESLKDVITTAIAPQSWDEVGGPGLIRSVGDESLWISQTYVHEQVDVLLKRLRGILAGEPGKTAVSATIDDEAEQRIRRGLDRTIELDFSEVPLKDVVNYLHETLQIPIVLNAKKLEEASLSPDTPVTCHWPKGRAGLYLDLLLKELELTYVIRDEVLQITTPEDAESQLITRIYDARPLLAAGISPDALFAILRNIVSPQSWDMVGGPGSIANFRGILVVSQTQDVLEKLDRLLVALTTRRAPKTHETEPPLMVRVDSPTSTATVEEALQQTIRVNLEEVALDEAIRQVTKPHHVSFLIDSKSLKEAGIVKMPIVSLPNAEMTLGGALSRLLNPLGLGYRVRDHLLWICTWEESDAHSETRLYRIDDLALSLDGAKSIREKLVAALADEQRVRIDEMSQAIELLGHSWLIVSAERASHQYIEDWLTEQRTGVPAKREVERRNLQDKLRWWGLRQRRPMPAGGMF
jgi:hypothetical protein